MNKITVMRNEEKGKIELLFDINGSDILIYSTNIFDTTFKKSVIMFEYSLSENAIKDFLNADSILYSNLILGIIDSDFKDSIKKTYELKSLVVDGELIILTQSESDIIQKIIDDYQMDIFDKYIINCNKAYIKFRKKQYKNITYKGIYYRDKIVYICGYDNSRNLISSMIDIKDIYIDMVYDIINPRKNLIKVMEGDINGLLKVMYTHDKFQEIFFNGVKFKLNMDILKRIKGE